MEENNDIIKRGRGRPRILTDEERNNNKTTYILVKSGIVKYVIQEEITH